MNGLFGNLFNGSQIHSMSVNFNINGNNLPHHLKTFGVSNQNNNMMIEGPKTSYLYTFKNVFIDNNYTLVISDDYDKDVRPKGEFDTLNNYYFVSTFPGQNAYIKYSEESPFTIAEIINRKDSLPPILTIVDHESFENKEIIDQILFNTLLLTRIYKHKNFFIVFETSGTKEVGEPFTTSFDKTKGLFKKEIYSINI